MVRSSLAPGRDFAVYKTDEFVQRVLNCSASPGSHRGFDSGQSEAWNLQSLGTGHDATCRENLPNEVRRPLPESLREVQEATRQAYLEFVQVRDDINIQAIIDNFDIDQVRELLPNGFGLDRVPPHCNFRTILRKSFFSQSREA